MAPIQPHSRIAQSSGSSNSCSQVLPRNLVKYAVKVPASAESDLEAWCAAKEYAS